MEKEKFYALLNKPATFNTETVNELKQITQEYPYFQAAWGLCLKWAKASEDPRFDQILRKAAPRIPDRKHLFHLLNPATDPLEQVDLLNQRSERIPGMTDTANKNRSPEHHLIDKFLSTAQGPVKLEKNKQENQISTPNNQLIAKSVTESDDLITETLALIYQKQKKYDKAIEAFQKLSLKYPEKSVYFASQIKELEKLKNI